MNSHTQMNRATQIALEFLLGDLDGLSLKYDRDTNEVFRDDWDVDHVKDYYESVVEDWPENYDDDYYAIFYTDKRTPCIDWELISQIVQDNRDDRYLQSLFW